MGEITVAREGAVLTIALNRPERLNSVTTEVLDDLADLIEEAGADPEVRVIVLTGTGRAFSSGADLKSGAAATGKPGTDTILAANRVVRALRDARQPTVAAVNGPAVGVGCSLALACDLVLAAESSYFGLAFVNIGLMPDGGSTLFVPAAVGKARAFQMALLGERVSAAQALDWGLANAVHPDAELIPQAEALVERLAAGPTRSYAGSKQALNQMLYANLDEQLELEAEIQHALARTSDFMEGVGAFAQKRPPAFSGA